MTSHDEAPRTLKPFSPFEELDSRILRGYCGAKVFGNPSPFHINPKAHAEEEESGKPLKTASPGIPSKKD